MDIKRKIRLTLENTRGYISKNKYPNGLSLDDDLGDFTPMAGWDWYNNYGYYTNADNECRWYAII